MNFNSRLAAVTMVLLTAHAAAAQDYILEILRAESGEARPFLQYEGAYQFDEDLENRPVDFSSHRHEFGGLLPIWFKDNDFWFINLELDYWGIDSGAVLPDSGRSLPDDIWDLRAGPGFYYGLENDWSFGGVFSIGSPSDDPFNSFDEVEIEGTGFLRIPHRDRNAWMFFANFSNNREFLDYVPIPGFAYEYHRGEELDALIGIPFAVAYRPVERLSLEATYLPVRNVHAKIRYGLTENMGVFTGFDWTNEQYLLAGRADDDDKLYYYQKQASLGVDYNFTKNLRFEVKGGYEFDRFFFQGEDYDDRHIDRVSIEDGPFVATKVQFRF